MKQEKCFLPAKIKKKCGAHGRWEVEKANPAFLAEVGTEIENDQVNAKQKTACCGIEKAETVYVEPDYQEQSSSCKKERGVIVRKEDQIDTSTKYQEKRDAVKLIDQYNAVSDSLVFTMADAQA
jgi:hypothetical protein